MATAMVMRFPGVTPEIYEQARETIGWESDPADGGLFHAAWFEGDELHVVDIWESPEKFQRFTQDRLGPGLAELGVTHQPEVEFHDVHRLFQPAPLPV
jgi:hypothetical protein